MKFKTVIVIFMALAMILSVQAVFAGGKKKDEAAPAAPAEEKAPAPEKKEAPAPAQVLVFGSSGDAARLDPGDVTDGESIQRMDNIFEGLVEYKRLQTVKKLHSI